MHKAFSSFFITAASFVLFSHLLPFDAGAQEQESLEQLAVRVFDRAQKQFVLLDSQVPQGKVPKSFEAGKLVCSSAGWWCSGFFPGSLLYLYEFSGNDRMLALSQRYLRTILPLSTGEVRSDHDIGFQVNSSFGNYLRLCGDSASRMISANRQHSLDESACGGITANHQHSVDECSCADTAGNRLPRFDESACREALVGAADLLCNRYSTATKAIRSWDSGQWQYPVIIDNMMNLELLMVASELTGDDRYSTIAHSHARTTAENHLRKDFTSFHLVDFDPATGAVLRRQTVQGYSDDSAWARGQSWALYGYTMMYDKSRDESYIAIAEGIAQMLLERLPEDGIPYWDFDDPSVPDTFRDASAAAIMSSAFAKLAPLSKNIALASQCRRMAETQVRTLASDRYLSPEGANGGFLLVHSVGNIPGNTEVDVPLSYADYYFLEAILRLRLLYH